MPKLTLSVDDEVIRKAKSWAAREGTSVSQLVESFLRESSAPPEGPRPAAPPVLQRLRGSLKGLDVEAHRRHLEAKYR